MLLVTTKMENAKCPEAQQSKPEAQDILKKLHISMSDAISMYLTQVTLQKGIPFDLKIPTPLTASTLRKSDNGEELHQADSVDQLFEDLES